MAGPQPADPQREDPQQADLPQVADPLQEEGLPPVVGPPLEVDLLQVADPLQEEGLPLVVDPLQEEGPLPVEEHTAAVVQGRQLHPGRRSRLRCYKAWHHRWPRRPRSHLRYPRSYPTRGT